LKRPVTMSMIAASLSPRVAEILFRHLIRVA
jgi:hypothetical protein